MPNLEGNGRGSDPELFAVDELISFKHEGESLNAQRYTIRQYSLKGENERDLAEIKSSLVNESELPPDSDGQYTHRQSHITTGLFRSQMRERVSRGKVSDVYDKGQSCPYYTGCILMPNESYGSASPSTSVCHTAPPVTPLVTCSDHHSSSANTLTSGFHRSHPSPDLPHHYSMISGPVGHMTSAMDWFSQNIVAGSQSDGVSYGTAEFPQMERFPLDYSHLRPGFSRSVSEHGKDTAGQRPHIKKPLNAFMLYMKEMRANVVEECTLKESAAINQILGKRWRALSCEEQAKYYELAQRERQLHMQLYPGWSARDNYGKKKKRKREKIQDSVRSSQISRFM